MRCTQRIRDLLIVRYMSLHFTYFITCVAMVSLYMVVLLLFRVVIQRLVSLLLSKSWRSTRWERLPFVHLTRH